MQNADGSYKTTWEANLFNGRWEWELSILKWTVVFLVVNFVSKKVSVWYGHPLDIRPTIVATGSHGLITALSSMYVMWGGVEAYPLWKEIFLPLSLGYNFHDIIIYCIPRKDMLILVHHLVVILTGYTVGEEEGAFLGGAGDGNWAVWVNLTGYVTELVVVVLAYRWWLSQTLEKHTTSFAVTGLLVFMSFFMRVVWMSYVLVQHIIPRFSLYVKYQQYLAFAAITLGYGSLVLLNIYWLYVILSQGFWKYMQFVKVPRTKGPFSFTTSFGGTLTDSASDKDKNKKKAN